MVWSRFQDTRRGTVTTPVSHALVRLYGACGKRTRAIILRLLKHAEGGEMYSASMRRVFSVYHGVDIGMYTHGGCFVVGNMRPGTSIGRYCSIGGTARTFTANHPMNLRSTHAVFVDPSLGLAKRQIFPRGRLSIGNDVWIGHNAVILPSVSSIGDGAVIGASAVVNKNVPPYAVVVGHPSRIVRYRFSQRVIDELLESRWWDKPLEELLPEFGSFQITLEGGEVR